ncbi:LOW QUALITY PROTEIN: hypothetical protein BRADI_1g69935v3 [Brachypodium distachyon]|uniref:Uncharacterized protein n=1 Tax=Brachypodium distachyon TaxID=15368 RepID=A0A2K2DUD3_BRADI|nr:LOW QUALITY PROTEIN: hypothetical protein BRADI_1g69935v3 [Brachypodium distachyon]
MRSLLSASPSSPLPAEHSLTLSMKISSWAKRVRRPPNDAAGRLPEIRKQFLQRHPAGMRGDNRANAAAARIAASPKSAAAGVTTEARPLVPPPRGQMSPTPPNESAGSRRSGNNSSNATQPECGETIRETRRPRAVAGWAGGGEGGGGGSIEFLSEERGGGGERMRGGLFPVEAMSCDCGRLLSAREVNWDRPPVGAGIRAAEGTGVGEEAGGANPGSGSGGADGADHASRTRTYLLGPRGSGTGVRAAPEPGGVTAGALRVPAGHGERRQRALRAAAGAGRLRAAAERLRSSSAPAEVRRGAAAESLRAYCGWRRGTASGSGALRAAADGRSTASSLHRQAATRLMKRTTNRSQSLIWGHLVHVCKELRWCPAMAFFGGHPSGFVQSTGGAALGS